LPARDEASVPRFEPGTAYLTNCLHWCGFVVMGAPERERPGGTPVQGS
jgi:hypothetical protein